MTPLLRAGLPRATRGQAVGLLGGSFDPAHDGHAAITRAALQRFGLDQVWWLVSPGNPLKSQGPAALDLRIAHAARVMDHPRVTITGLEAQLGTRYTADTLAAVQHLWRGVQFVWLMGSDNLASFHRWANWQTIAAQIPIGVLARPGSQLAALSSPAARHMARHRIPAAQSLRLAHSPGPAWCMVTQPLNASSSTAIRASGAWHRGPGLAPAPTPAPN